MEYLFIYKTGAAWYWERLWFGSDIDAIAGQAMVGSDRVRIVRDRRVVQDF